MTDLGGTASDYFASMIEEYDSLIRRAVPNYEMMLSTTLEYLPRGPDRGLELGCGTGNFTLALADRFPDCRWTTVDAAEEMVDLTGARVAEAGAAGRVECTLGRFEEMDFDSGSFDVITSCISLHHVVDKAALFASLHRMLRPGGSLCFADQLTGAAPRIADRHWERWLEHCRASGQCTGEEVDHLVEHSEAHDHYESLAAHAQYLRDAGFVEIDCAWRDGMWAVVTAEAPAG